MSGAPYLNNAGVFLIETVFGLYILALMLRFLLQWVRADFYNPLVQFLVKITNPPLLPLRRWVPGLFGLDMAAVVLMFGLQALEWGLVLSLGGLPLGVTGLVVLSVAELASRLVNVFLWAVIIQAVMSWFVRDPYNPLYAVVNRITAPLMRPAGRLLPPMGGLDLSPLIVIVALQLVAMLLVAPLRDLGFGLLRGW